MCGLIYCSKCNCYRIPLLDNKFISKCCLKCTQQFTRITQSTLRTLEDEDEEIRSIRKSSSLSNVADSEVDESSPRHQVSVEELTNIRSRISMPPSSDFLNVRTHELLESFELNQSWKSLLIELTLTAVNTVWPSVKYRRDKANINEYVKALPVEWGDSTLSAYYSGVIFKHNVAHKRMRIHIKNPKILVLSGGAEFCSAEIKLISMDTVLDQEAEFNRILVKKITSIKPDVVFVEKGMSQNVLGELTQRSITTVLNVKRRHLDMIARVTNSQVMSSVDQISTAQNSVGTCGEFSVKKWGRLSFIMLNESPDPIMGGTIVLSGPNQAELLTLKTVLKKLLVDYRDFILEHNILSQCGLECQEIVSRPVSIDITMIKICSRRQCEAPQPIVIDFYSDRDLPLGQFVSKTIQSSDELCESQIPGSQHKFYFISYKGVLKVSVETPSTERTQVETIEFTRICKECNDRMGNFLLNIASWEFSFYHFVYLFLTLDDLALCGHNFFKSSYIQLSSKQSIIKMKWTEAKIYDLLPMTPCRSISEFTKNVIETQLNEVKEAVKHCLDKVYTKVKDLLMETIDAERLCASENIEAWQQFTQEIKNLCGEITNLSESLSSRQAIQFSSLLEVETLRRESFYKFIGFTGQVDRLTVSISNTKMQGEIQVKTSTSFKLGVEPAFKKTLDVIGPRTESLGASSNDPEAPESPMLPEAETMTRIYMDGLKWDFLRKGQLSLPLGASTLCIPVDENDLLSLICHSLNTEEYKAYVVDPASPQDVLRHIIESELLVEQSSHLRVKGTSYTPSEGIDSIKEHAALYGEPIEFTVKIYFVRQFHAMRMHLTNSNEEYLDSIHKSAGSSKALGKSGARFAFSHDGKYLIKEFNEAKEVKMFLDMAPSYFRHVCKSFYHDMPSRMVHTLGFYKIATKNMVTGIKKASYVFLLENIGFNLPEPRMTYDLKGTLNANRHVKPGTTKTKMDVNFVEDSEGLPLFLSMNAKSKLETSVHNDTLYLSKQNVMDYSMLVMFNPKERLLAAAIIDYSGQYNIEKAIESTFKRAVRTDVPTVINPEDYKQRFRKTMSDVFFLGVSESSP
eukprot:CAMPEP_0204905326 /NCGR_PEP_ID=MMETSP1397-20131031/5360_1 /ASSEMBLY_ACC=CAM_ASM_000891 /TAXON_ID=49980 /ORGANISM="Climacostomum Climacostomum virens, Strain Stock W-24" /LENGTH=1081 /DNA_ID=CAMNT_0052074199 /DNA_START=1491 /DNA_END=4736 /DNA_ORIENTATION=-